MEDCLSYKVRLFWVPGHIFGLSNSLANFQGYINKILTKKLDVFIIIYSDNILISIKESGQPYIEAICWVFNQL